MNNFIKRTLSGAFFVALIMVSILLDAFTYAIIFSIVTGLSVWEFHKLTNQVPEVKVNRWMAVVGAVILFACSFIHASNILQFPVFTIYGLYLVGTFIVELYLKKKGLIHYNAL